LQVLRGGLLALRTFRLLLGLQPSLLGTALRRPGFLACALRLLAPLLEPLRLPFAHDVHADGKNDKCGDDHDDDHTGIHLDSSNRLLMD